MWRIRICGFNFVTKNTFLAIVVLRIVHSKSDYSIYKLYKDSNMYKRTLIT